jgi:hypothetical protein
LLVGFGFVAALEALLHLRLLAIFSLLFFLAFLECLLATSSHGSSFPLPVRFMPARIRPACIRACRDRLCRTQRGALER